MQRSGEGHVCSLLRYLLMGDPQSFVSIYMFYRAKGSDGGRTDQRHAIASGDYGRSVARGAQMSLAVLLEA